MSLASSPSDRDANITRQYKVHTTRDIRTGLCNSSRKTPGAPQRQHT